MCKEARTETIQRKTVAEEIGEEYKKWYKKGIILLNMAMGRGKTHFIIEILGKHAKENNERILYLVNRSALKKENEQRACEMGIQIESYQKIQQEILDAYYDGNEYEVDVDYIVCDECHYFILDAWNGKTDVIYDWIMKRGEVLRIFMSATTGYNKNLFKVFRNDYAKYHRFRKEYTVEADYSYIEKIVFYESADYVAKLIEEIPENEKLIYFSKKLEDVHDIYKGCKQKASFICSESKSNYKKYIDKEAIDEQFRMTKQVVCTTSVLDNGINIKDEQLKHVVVEFDDMIQLIQSLGRKRVWKFEDGQVVLPPEERITVYVKNWSKGELQNFKRSKESDIREVELNKNENKDENKDEKNEYFKSENKKEGC